MRRAALLLLGALGLASANIRELRLKKNATAFSGDEAKKDFLSIPQDDPDPAARARRLNYRGEWWAFAPYPAPANRITMGTYGGVLGDAQKNSELALVGGQIAVSSFLSLRYIDQPISGKCNQLGGNCLQHFSSYEPLYEALDKEYQPASYKFWDSDYAFARERITSSPAFLTRANSLADVPFTQSDVVGYDAITGGVPMAQLVAEKRLFIVNFMPLYEQGLLVAAPDAYLEVPTAVFFLTGPPQKNGGAKQGFSAKASKSSRLMPLAIKFNVYNQNVYSPKDTHADWFLAKAAFNALDRDVNAIYHFALHTAIANIAISANKYLASEHPLYHPISMAANHNTGIIFAGVQALLPPRGLFDSYLSLAGPNITALLFPYYTRTFDWQQTFLTTSLASRGVTDIPGFLYRDDGAATYKALETYVKQYLKPFYNKPSDVQGDTELMAFLAPLSNAVNAYTPQNVAYLKGFPAPADMRTPEDVVRMLTQILWIAGVSHHSLNSYRILNYDLVYPNHPGKILSAPPAQKGQLTDDQVMARYIAGTQLGVNSLSSGPMNLEAQAWVKNTETDVDAQSIGTPIQFFIGTQKFAFDFYPLLQKPERLTNAFLSNSHDKQSAAAAAQLRSNLLSISKKIEAREAATTDAPKYTLLDPIRLPFYLYI